MWVSWASRAVWVLACCAIVGSVAGVGIAAVTVKVANQNAVGNYVAESTTVTGITQFQSTILALPATHNLPTGTAAAPLALVNGGNVFCVFTACTATDESDRFTITFSASLTGSIMIPITLKATANSGATTVYYKQTPVAVAGTIVLYWDIGAGSPLTASVTVAIDQCVGAGGSCP
ncbi:MAG: hypothetical protein L3K03_09400 [Thermoplasmata archaeon]|nr:hypothetical protein [Thermoplasmata archaeon]